MLASTAPFLFASFCVSVILAKCIRLFIYAPTISFRAAITFWPSCFLPDLIVMGVVRLLLRSPRGLQASFVFVSGIFLSALALGGAASELGFNVETGGELNWHQALAYATDEEGLEVLLSGRMSVIYSGLFILVLAWFSRTSLYATAGHSLTNLGRHTSHLYYYGQRWYQDRKTHKHLPDIILEDGLNSPFMKPTFYLSFNEEVSNNSYNRLCSSLPPFSVKTLKFIFIICTIATCLVRPSRPYSHLSVTLPIRMLEILQSREKVCSVAERNKWPLPGLIESSLWEDRNGNFKGWAPGSDSELSAKYQGRVPDWLPAEVPPGFSRWGPHKLQAQRSPESIFENNSYYCPRADPTHAFYNPVADPLKITNLDAEIVEPLREVLQGGSIKIRHIVIITMESMRQDLFPIHQESDIQRYILKYNTEPNRQNVDILLSKLTPFTGDITGKPGYPVADGSPYDTLGASLGQEDMDYGSLNIIGAQTGATISTKSFATTHCGVWPMPVDNFDEADSQPYQPCFPQILELYNQVKDKQQSPEDFLEQQWYPAFFQSVTDEFDRQDLFNKKIGFKYSVAEKELAKYWDSDPLSPAAERTSYFGYSETALRSHIIDYIKKATANNQRIFMSHFTSTTHHPWAAPSWFKLKRYLPRGWINWHKSLNKYLNTIHFHDAWLGELMHLFENLGIADETLVVLVGDHGQAFDEDSSKTGTYENGHASNLMVPIVFRHPAFPPVQITSPASTISILPTVLDLLINSGSLNEKDTEIASDLIHDYEGQSLIRRYKTSHNCRRAWNFIVINPGASLLGVTSADSPWKIVIPLGKMAPFEVTNINNDMAERNIASAWSMEELIPIIRLQFGEKAVKWVIEAEAVGKWWALDRKRLWGHA